MADIKISEMDELFPYDDYTGEGGVESLDYLTILDVSELQLEKVNKKVTVSTLLEKHATINSPSFSGNPSTPTPSLSLVNSNYIPNISWVSSKLGNISLGNLTDVEDNLQPEDGQTLVYNAVAGEWRPGSANTVAREEDITTLTLDNASASYQFIGSTQAQSTVELPNPPVKGMKFTIKNITPSTTVINIKEDGGTITTVDLNSQVAECIYDGVEWQILSF